MGFTVHLLCLIYVVVFLLSFFQHFFFISGKNVTIKDSYLWNNVIIEDNCTIEKSLLCDNVTVYNNVKVCPYCLLSWNVS